MPKILVVDDQEYVRLLYSEELSEAGYEVITADGGYELLEKIKGEKPDLVIMAIKMGDCNGLDLLQDIRSQFHHLPVILSTVYHRFKNDIRSIAADFFVEKSYDLTELKAKAAMALEARDAESSPCSYKHASQNKSGRAMRFTLTKKKCGPLIGPIAGRNRTEL